MTPQLQNRELRDAVRANAFDKVKYLQSHGFGPNGGAALLSVDALRAATQSGDQDSVRQLMANAASAQDPKLVAYGADRAWRVAHSYLREGDERRAIAVMSAMPEVFLRDANGKQVNDALALSARNHMRTVSDALIGWGADPSVKDPQQRTALMHFALHGDAQLLDSALKALEKRFNSAGLQALRQVDADGWPASFFAASSEAPHESKAACLTVMKNRGWDFNQRHGQDGFMEIHLTAGLGDTATIRHLMDVCKADANGVSGNQLTPVMAAAWEGQDKSIPILWSYGSNLDVRRVSDGLSAAHMAAVRHQAPCLEQLNKCGANLQIRRFDTQETPSDMARHTGLRATARLIDGLQPPTLSPRAEEMAQRLNDLLAPVRRTARALGLGR